MVGRPSLCLVNLSTGSGKDGGSRGTVVCVFVCVCVCVFDWVVR